MRALPPTSRSPTGMRSRASARWRRSKGSCPRSNRLLRSAGSSGVRWPRARSYWSTCRAGATRTSRRCGPRLTPSRGRRVAELEPTLRSRLHAGGRAFVPYVTGGLAGVDAELLRGLEEAGADAIEVGIPFSDPVMDGPVIQEASRRALVDGATPTSVLGSIKEAGLKAPVAVMTYANPVWHAGHGAFLDACVDAG